MGSSVILPPPGQPVEGLDVAFKSAAIPTSATFKFSQLLPPTALYIMPDDLLELVGMSTIVGETVVFRVRFLHVALPVPGQPDTGLPQTLPVVDAVSPYIGIYDFQVPITVARTLTVLRPNLGEGFILSVFAAALSAPTRGQTFARAAIFRGVSGGATGHNVVLISDYVDVNYSVSGPGSTIRHYLEGPGSLHSLQQANPAPGTDWTLTVLSKQRLRIESLNAQLATSGAVATRTVELVVDDGTNVMFRIPANISQAANLTVQYTAGALGTPSTVVATDAQINLPPGLLLASGWKIRTVTTNIQGADQWSAIWLNVEEWLDF